MESRCQCRHRHSAKESCPAKIDECFTRAKRERKRADEAVVELAQVTAALAEATRSRSRSLRRLPQDPGQQHQSRRAQAEEALAAAYAGEDVPALQHAIAFAEGAGMAADVLEEGRRRLADLQRQISRQRAAVAAIDKALAEEDTERLSAALGEAAQCGVSEEALEDGRRRLRSLQHRVRQRREAAEALRSAQEAEDVVALEEALRQAESVGVSDLQPTREHLRRMQADWQARKAAEAAAERGDVAGLEALLANANGISPGIAQDAVRKLQALQAQEQLKAEARASLEAASEGGDVDALAAAIEKAEGAGVSKPLLQDTVRRLQALQAQKQLKAEARASLVAASEGGDVDALAAAIEKAEEAGVSKPLLQESRVRMRKLNERHADMLREENRLLKQQVLDERERGLAERERLVQEREQEFRMRSEQHIYFVDQRSIQAAGPQPDYSNLLRRFERLTTAPSLQDAAAASVQSLPTRAERQARRHGQPESRQSRSRTPW